MAPKTILITGGLGDVLAQAFHRRGHRVIATARNPSKIAHFAALNVDTLPLDTLSPSSIAQCVASVAAKTGGSLDMLINNAGSGYTTPLADASIESSRKLFDLNVWSALAVTQAFLPLLLQSPAGALIANNTSISSVAPTLWGGIYNASKAALSALTDTLRLELAPFGIKVVDLKTGVVRSQFFSNLPADSSRLPEGSIYMPARDVIEKFMGGEAFYESAIPADKWANQVVCALLASRPPVQVWKGANAWPVWFMRAFAPFTAMDGMIGKMGGLDELKKALAAQGRAKQQ